jgi:type IV pilus assembly protein PilC
MHAQNGAFPEILVNMVEAGESGGTLDNVMGRLAGYFEKMLKTSNKIKSAMMYPVILAVLTVCVVTMLLMFVLPVFIDLFESSGAPLPAPTRVLIGISRSLTSYWYIYLIVISTVMIAFMNYLKNEKGRMNWDRFKTRVPVVGKLNVTVISARFARTLSAMMQSGIPLLKSLEITAKVLDNKYFERQVADIRDDIKKGIPLSASLKKSGIFPLMLLSMISIGEESGTLDSVLIKTSDFYDEESDAAISKMVGILEPLMIIVMAAVIGFIVVSIMLPMFTMSTLINK